MKDMHLCVFVRVRMCCGSISQLDHSERGAVREQGLRHLQ